MQSFAVAFFLLLTSPSAVAQKPAAMQVRPVPDDAIRLHTRFTQNLSPSAHTKIQTAGARLAASIKQQPTMPTAQIQSSARTLATQSFPSLRGTDIDAMCFEVLMETTNDQDADLQQIMNEVKQQTAQKQALRSQMNTAQPASANSSDVSSEQQMRLQTMMDQRSKLLEALSNIMKSASNTQNSIIQNMK